MTRTADELSIVCAYDAVPAGVRLEGPWRAFRVRGPIVMTRIGVLAALADPLADAGISIFAISTFDTDSDRFAREVGSATYRVKPEETRWIPSNPYPRSATSRSSSASGSGSSNSGPWRSNGSNPSARCFSFDSI